MNESMRSKNILFKNFEIDKIFDTVDIHSKFILKSFISLFTISSIKCFDIFNISRHTIQKSTYISRNFISKSMSK